MERLVRYQHSSLLRAFEIFLDVKSFVTLGPCAVLGSSVVSFTDCWSDLNLFDDRFDVAKSANVGTLFLHVFRLLSHLVMTSSHLSWGQCIKLFKVANTPRYYCRLNLKWYSFDVSLKYVKIMQEMRHLTKKSIEFIFTKECA